MRSILFMLLLSALSISITHGQTSTTANTGGTGWKRIAHITGATGGRGFGTVSIYTTGGDFRPVVTNIDWFHDWSVKAGVSVKSNTQDSPYWSAVRITDDGTNNSCYIEVYFTKDITGLKILSDDYGWNTATLYSGTLPVGAGTVRTTANIDRFNIENKFTVAYDGNVGIGTADPQAKLAVNGMVLATEVKVKTDISVPDYVFEPDYNLPTLAEVEAHIKKHKHLPEIPSAADIQRDGLNLAEMNLLLLKKVEELTLHLIQLHDDNTTSQQRIGQLEVEIDQLKSLMK